ncbi:hypothetical protein M1271_04480 [Patescibacteria group bacterium]|nr:hypothetical protein [Patescibacteria group bacterium]
MADKSVSSLMSSDPLAGLPGALRLEMESWVVNSVKVKMIKKLDLLLEDEGRSNARKLFLVPIFTINSMVKRVEDNAPELKTLFYKELVQVIKEAGDKISG